MRWRLLCLLLVSELGCSVLFFFARLVKLSIKTPRLVIVTLAQISVPFPKHLQLLSLLHSKLVLILAIQVHNLLTQPCLLHLLLEIVKRIQEDIIVTIYKPQSALFSCTGKEQAKNSLVVYRNSQVRIDHSDKLDSLLCIHGHHQHWQFW